MIIEEKKHAVLGPSGSSRWIPCPGSVKLESYFPNTSSKYAEWGTAAHELSDICLREGNNAENHIGRTFTINGNVYTVDMEMADCVNDYMADVYSLVDPEEGDTLLSEEQVPLTQITGEEDAEGTSDVIGISACQTILTVIDLKTGQGVKVDAFDADDYDQIRPHDYDPATCTPNTQMTMYAGGSLEKYKNQYPNIDTVRMVISQPRINWLDSCEITVADLEARLAKISEAAGVATLNEGETLVPGEKQCKFCRAKSTCPALRGVVFEKISGNKAKASTSSSFSEIDTEQTLAKKAAATIGIPDDDEALAQSMRAIPLIEAWIKGVQEGVASRLFNAQPVPGFKLVLGKKGNRAWRDEEAARAAIIGRGKLKAADAEVRKLVTPTQAAALFKKQFKDTDVKWAEKWAAIETEQVTQSDGNPSVAPVSDPRDEYRIASTEDTFSGIAVGQGGAEISPTLASALA
jgi:hypothetical protein